MKIIYLESTIILIDKVEAETLISQGTIKQTEDNKITYLEIQENPVQ